MKIVLLPEAEVELIAAEDWYKSGDIASAKAFVEEADRVLQQIALFPQSGPRKFNFRRCLFLEYPYAVIYKVFPDHVLVIAIIHTSRRPGYWRKRVIQD